jgi:hypothetical protein
MSSATDFAYSATPPEAIHPYRAISRSAVLALLFALIAAPFAVLTLLSLYPKYGGDGVALGFWTAAVSVFAVALGCAGLASIRRYPNEYTGKWLALIGLALGLVQTTAGISAASYTYMTEVPEGYTRVGFWELRPDPEQPLGVPISQKAIDLHEKQIFIKGYMHPGVASGGRVNHFILVPDMGTCCFGGQPKPYDMIEVFIPDKTSRVAYSTRKIKLAGDFVVGQSRGKTLGLNDVWYHMQVDQVR